LRVAGAVRFVAVRAVLHHRRVLPDEGATAFGVATETVFVRRALDKLLGIGSAVGIVATRAGNLALAVRHVRRALQLGAAHLVALQAKLRLGFLYAAVLGQRGVVARLGSAGYVNFLLDLVAIHASHAAGFVRAAPPEEVGTFRVAIHADGVLLGDGVLGVFSETDGDGVLAAPCLHVSSAGAVAGFASAGLFGRVGMCHGLAHDGVLEAAILVLVAGDAGFAPDIVAIGVCGGRSFGFFPGGRRRRLITGRLPSGGVGGEGQRNH